MAPKLANNTGLQSAHLDEMDYFELHCSCVCYVRRPNGGERRLEEVSSSWERSSISGDDNLCVHTAAHDEAHDAAPR